ncbi:heme exporter protein CcmB [Abyssibacter sp.]|uniref:heme exporter protein CcmB n=2 Tax=Abyssibacter sp. TaxID=2320200 RepID=UPI0025C5A654|nr:heme exporter protein CcmB [Abyssibacter sp.]MCK5858070.1 heme exporter protein CcmB [Abyssibacter sp.]
MHRSGRRLNAMGIWGAVWTREWQLLFRQRQDLLQPLTYFTMVVMIVPLGVDPADAVLTLVAPAIVWIAVVLAVVLSLDRLFRDDARDGTLAVLLTAPTPLWWVLLAKLGAHWLGLGSLLAIAAPIAGAAYGLSLAAAGVLFVTVIAGTLGLMALGLVAGALTVGLRNGGVLVAIILLPLYVPLLVFGAGAVAAVQSGFPGAGPVYFTAALSMLYATLAPPLAAVALRLSYD